MTTSVLELDGKVVLLVSSERGLYRRVPLFGVTWLARRPVRLTVTKALIASSRAHSPFYLLVLLTVLLSKFL